MACLQSVSHNLAACDEVQNAPVCSVALSNFPRTKSNATWAESVGLSCMHNWIPGLYVANL